MELIQSIANECVAYLREGKCPEDVLSDKLLQVFRKGMPLLLCDDENYKVDILGTPIVDAGELEDIHFSYDEHRRVDGVLIALCVKEGAEKRTDLYAMDKLVSVHY
jgi:hypothetical protein